MNTHAHEARDFLIKNNTKMRKWSQFVNSECLYTKTRTHTHTHEARHFLIKNNMKMRKWSQLVNSECLYTQTRTHTHTRLDISLLKTI